MKGRHNTRLDALEKAVRPDPPKLFVCWCGGDDGQHIPDCPCYGVDLQGATVVTVGVDLELL